MARVTVLMPVYNCEKYLAKAISSILRQSFKDFQLLIIDDASSDQSAEIIGRLTDKRIIYLRNDKNLGLAETLNRGLSSCDSEFLVRMDGDDISLSRRLEWQIKFMEDNPDLDISGSWLRTFGGLTNKGLIRYPTSHESMRVLLVFATPLAHPTTIIRFNRWSEAGLRYNPSYTCTEDFDLWSRAIRKFRFGNLPLVTYLYRRHSGSATLARNVEMRNQYRIIVKRELEDLGIIAESEDLHLHIAIGLREKINSFADLQKADNWLSTIKDQLISNGHDPSSVNEALSLIWYRYARNAAWLGWKGYRICLTSRHMDRDNLSTKDVLSFRASVIYHLIKG